MLFGIIVRKTKGMKENIVSQAKKKDNIYKSYAPHEREIIFLFFFLFWKTTYKNKHYFYQIFLLTKDSFPFTSFFYAIKYWKM